MIFSRGQSLARVVLGLIDWLMLTGIGQFLLEHVCNIGQKMIDIIVFL